MDDEPRNPLPKTQTADLSHQSQTEDKKKRSEGAKNPVGKTGIDNKADRKTFLEGLARPLREPLSSDYKNLLKST